MLTAIMIVCAFSFLLQTVFKGLCHPDFPHVCGASSDRVGGGGWACFTKHRTGRWKDAHLCLHQTRAERQPVRGTVLCPPLLRTQGQLPPTQGSHRGRFWRNEMCHLPLSWWFQRWLDAGVAGDAASDSSPHTLPEQLVSDARGSAINKDHGWCCLMDTPGGAHPPGELKAEREREKRPSQDPGHDFLPE